jgi:signal transduction histidine kinase/ActR/RegA family two-component response regulator
MSFSHESQHASPAADAAPTPSTVVGWTEAGLITFCSTDLDQGLVGAPLAGTLLPLAAFEALSRPVLHAPLRQALCLRLPTRLQPDGELACDWHSLRLPAAAGRPAEILSVLIDVGAQARAKEELRTLREQQDSFMAALSHELRDPLAPLRNAAYLLRNVAPDSAQRGEIVQLIERQIDQMARRLDRLLDASRTSGAAAGAPHAPVHLQLALREAVEQVSARVDAAGHTLLRKVPARPIRVQGDAARIAQMIATLLENAVRFTPAGGVIELSLQQTDDGKAVVTVKDNGAGIARSELDRLFDGPSQQPSDDAARGLRLATVKALAAAHGGSVRAASEGPGRGAAFSLTLPLLQEPAAPAPSPRSTGRPGLRVVVVDDNRDNADTLNTLLTMMGHQVRVGYDGNAALQAAAVAPFDAMLLDVGLPDLDGYEVARQLRARGISAPLIAVSGYGQPRDKERALAAGFDRHLTKPVSIRDVATVLAHVAQGLGQDAQATQAAHKAGD